MKNITIGILGLVLGALISFLIIYFSTPRVMFKENKSNYDFERSIEEFKKSVEANNWKLPHVTNLQATMKKFGKDVLQVQVFDVCNPDLAFKILSHDDERIVSSLMPCRVAIYEKSDGKVYYSRMNSGLMSKPMNKVIRETMAEAAEGIEVILEPLKAE